LVVIPRKVNELDKFAISRTEIKVEDYNQYCDQAGCERLTEDDSSLPITNLTIDNARDYAQWLSELSGKQYRLPTPAEWTWAVKTDKYEGADYNVNCTVDSRGVRLGETLKKALSGKPNRWGLYNSIGNAREWAEDSESLVTIGGAHTDPMSVCRDENIYSGDLHTGEADPITGFRVLRQIVSS
jgi:formylglycine-generating enzyme required for sulfatase activity